MRPISIPEYIVKHFKQDYETCHETNQIKARITCLGEGTPLVSVIIPAYNEQNSILRTIASLSYTVATYPVEIIVVDNNSTDATKEQIEKCGVRYLFEEKKGVKHARGTGLREAQGIYVLSGDADTIYSPYWVDSLVSPLIQNRKIACVHGKFSFIPENGYSRISFFFYEIVGDIYKRVNSFFKDPAIYVYGCSSAFRKAQALAVDGYSHPPGSNEDGYLGLKLRNKFGRLKQVRNADSLAWTSSRKFVSEGTLTYRIFKKIQRIFN